MRLTILVSGALALGLSACSSAGQGNAAAQPSDNASSQAAAIPEKLAPFGDGYPAAGDPCRKLGESAATSNYLDDSAILVGCPSEAAAKAVGGKVVGNVDGIRLVSIPMGDANVGMVSPVGENGPPPPPDTTSIDVKVPGTDYNATAQIPCGFKGMPPTGSCFAGVKRKWGEDGTTLVEVTKPDGMKRALFFKGTTPYGADSAQADGSAGWDFKVSRKGDEVTIKFGPETYVVVDALVEGG
ncbi:hypothetical protein [Tsuneonella mangrovi]|uniref:hypothetical protein n=1 Tax=Tsuneonella mangrovi TaxID=1982042 RepID=UPI000BA2239F|nr:hypothetical protein [Tsuneonella mangrovi]